MTNPQGGEHASTTWKGSRFDVSVSSSPLEVQKSISRDLLVASGEQKQCADRESNAGPIETRQESPRLPNLATMDFTTTENLAVSMHYKRQEGRCVRTTIGAGVVDVEKHE